MENNRRTRLLNVARTSFQLRPFDRRLSLVRAEFSSRRGKAKRVGSRCRNKWRTMQGAARMDNLSRFRYNSAALAMRSLFPDGDPCATPVRCACDGRGKSRNGIFQPVVDLFFFVLFRFVRFLRHVWFKILRYE